MKDNVIMLYGWRALSIRLSSPTIIEKKKKNRFLRTMGMRPKRNHCAHKIWRQFTPNARALSTCPFHKIPLSTQENYKVLRCQQLPGRILLYSIRIRAHKHVPCYWKYLDVTGIIRLYIPQQSPTHKMQLIRWQNYLCPMQKGGHSLFAAGCLSRCPPWLVMSVNVHLQVWSSFHYRARF